MCDGDYNDGCGDPDYYDLEFRLQNPDVYGNDEYMTDMYPSQTRRQKSATQRRYTRNDSDFSPEYLQWKAMHPDRVAYFQKHAGEGQYKGKDELSGCEGIVVVIVLAVPVFFLFFLIFG
ncbi:MAG: hypothetical protein IKX36_03925 [Prevotella sp.]|nr:hypothetical protein [Prevotella sp.]